MVKQLIMVEKKNLSTHHVVDKKNLPVITTFFLLSDFFFLPFLHRLYLLGHLPPHGLWRLCLVRPRSAPATSPCLPQRLSPSTMALPSASHLAT